MLIPVDVERLGVIASGHVEPVMPWVEKDGRRQPGTEQERDEATGHPLWTVHALVLADSRPTAIAVRVPAPSCPEPPALQPAAFERLECNVRVNRTNNQLASYWSAAGIAAPAQHRGNQKSEQAAA